MPPHVIRALVVVLALLAVGCASDSPSSNPPPATSGATTTTTPGSTPTDTTPPAACTVTPAEVWIAEGEIARAQLDCDVALRADEAPAGVGVSDGTVTWMPALDQAGTHTIELVGEGAAATWTVAVADAFADPDNVPVVEPEQLTHEYGLEVLHLFSDDPLSTEFAPTTLVHDGRSVDAEVRVRGALSLQYPKPNFAVRLDEPFRSDDPRFDGLDRLVLVAGFDDNSLVRNRLAQQLWADMDPAHLAVGDASTVVYLDGEYLGVYTMVEGIDEQYLRRHDLDPTGQLFKAEDARADFRLDDDPDPRAGFDKKSGEPEDGPAALGPIADLVEFAAESDDIRFADDLAQWVDVDDLVDWFAFVTFISAGDSANKNAYWYQAADGVPFRYLPWDFNHSFGQDFVTERIPADQQLAADFATRNGLFERSWAQPGLQAAMIDRFEELLAESFDPTRLTALVDDLEAELGPNLARNDQRWGSTHDGFRLWETRDDVTDGAGELAYIRQWIADRHAAITAELEAVASAP